MRESLSSNARCTCKGQKSSKSVEFNISIVPGLCLCLIVVGRYSPLCLSPSTSSSTSLSLLAVPTIYMYASRGCCPGLASMVHPRDQDHSLFMPVLRTVQRRLNLFAVAKMRARATRNENDSKGWIKVKFRYLLQNSSIRIYHELDESLFLFPIVPV